MTLAQIQNTVNREPDVNDTSWRMVHHWMHWLANSGRYDENSKFNQYYGKEGSYEAGTTYNILKDMGCMSIEDNIVPCLQRPKEVLHAIQTRKNPNKGGRVIIQLNSQLLNFGGLLLMMRKHPRLKQLLEEEYEFLDREYRIMKNTVAAQQLEKQDNEKITHNYKEMVRLVEDTFQKHSKEYLIVRMFEETPSRWEILKLGINTNAGNRIVIDKKKKEVSYVFEEYKTKRVFGVVKGKYSKAVSKLIIDYVAANPGQSTLFGRDKSFVRVMFDKLSQAVPRFERTRTVNVGDINLLRKMYASSYFGNTRMNAAEREKLAILMRHSPMMTLRYLRSKKDLTIPANTHVYAPAE